MENTCGSLKPDYGGFNEHKDNDRCIKPDGHNDYHVFKSEKGKMIAWEYDYTCDRECDCWEKGGECYLIWEINP